MEKLGKKNPQKIANIKKRNYKMMIIKKLGKKFLTFYKLIKTI